MKNPIVAAREALGLSRSEAALKMGTNYQSMMRIELGHPGFLPEKPWRPRFEAIGVDFDKLAADYLAYRAAMCAVPQPQVIEG